MRMVRALRLAMGKSQIAVEAATGVSQGQQSAFEQGLREPSEDVRHRLEAFYGQPWHLLAAEITPAQLLAAVAANVEIGATTLTSV